MNPTKIKIDDEIFPINTDFRTAIKCNEIALDETIGDYERALAIIYILFGEKGLNATTMHDKLIALAQRYISLNKNKKSLKTHCDDTNFKLDFKKCEGLIKSSFKFDYGYDPYEKEYLHWYDFYNDLENLATSEFGNCCILSRVQEILNQEPSKIEDCKERQKLIDAQKELKEKYCIEEHKQTEQQRQSAEEFYRALKGG